MLVFCFLCRWSNAMNPVVSVVICTHNRAECLNAALGSIFSQEASTDEFEVIVVDNASTDRTQEAVKAWSAKYFNLKYLFETVLGLSRARNAGMNAALGEYIAYIDDDAMADQGWLAHIPTAFAAAGSAAGCVAGRIAPIWGAPRPAWLDNELLGYITVLDCSPVARWLKDYEHPYGANVVFTRDALFRAGGFSTTLGRKGSALLSNEEILLHRRLKGIGYRTYYDPWISVQHHVPAERLTKSWFKKRAYWQGVSDALLDRQLEGARQSEVTIRGLRKLVSLVKKPGDIMSLVTSQDDPVRFLAAFNVLKKMGYGAASLQIEMLGGRIL
jgi:glycosyltransferase involved in cell wall biosynthesis